MFSPSALPSIAEEAAGPPGGWFRRRALFLAPLCPDWRGPTIALGTRNLELRHANRPARDMLRRGLVARLRGNRLALLSPHGARRLAEILRGLESRQGAAATLVIADRHAEPAMALRIHLPDLPPSETGEPIAIVEFVDTSLDLPPAQMAAIAEAFGLTVAEGGVLALLAAGHSLREIAVLRGVHIETVRNQCKTVLGKMRCRRQADLVRIVATLAQRDISGAAD